MKQLLDLVEQRYGVEGEALVKPLLQSIQGKNDALSFHMVEASKVFSDFYQQEEVPTGLAIKALLSGGLNGKSLYSARLKFEAHLVASAHALHSMSDILARLIIVALGLTYPDDQRIKLQGVHKLLPNGALKSSVVNLIGLADYRYLQDFVNINKHMSLVFANYRISPSDDRHGVRFQEFTFEGRTHDQKWGDEVRSCFERVAEGQLRVGCEINNSQVHKVAS